MRCFWLVIVCVLCLGNYVFVWWCCLSLMLFVLGFLCYLYVVVLFCYGRDLDFSFCLVLLLLIDLPWLVVLSWLYALNWLVMV